MDRYYFKSKKQLDETDLQLTATTCLFIASKSIMVQPFSLQNAADTMCYKKYSLSQFLDKE